MLSLGEVAPNGLAVVARENVDILWFARPPPSPGEAPNPPYEDGGPGIVPANELRLIMVFRGAPMPGK